MLHGTESYGQKNIQWKEANLGRAFYNASLNIIKNIGSKISAHPWVW